MKTLRTERRRHGCSPRSALLLTLAGIACTWLVWHPVSLRHAQSCRSSHHPHEHVHPSHPTLKVQLQARLNGSDPQAATTAHHLGAFLSSRHALHTQAPLQAAAAAQRRFCQALPLQPPPLVLDVPWAPLGSQVKSCGSRCCWLLASPLPAVQRSGTAGMKSIHTARPAVPPPPPQAPLPGGNATTQLVLRHGLQSLVAGPSEIFQMYVYARGDIVSKFMRTEGSWEVGELGAVIGKLKRFAQVCGWAHGRVCGRAGS